MNNINLEKNNDINLEKNIKKEIEQRNFLESTLGKTVNTAIDIGIRSLLPDFLDEQIINLKNNLFNYGLKDGITKTIDDTIDLGKSALGIVTGNFDNISQMQNAVKSGGLIDGVSTLLDTVVDKVRKEGLINNDVARTIKQGKNVILNNIETNIENTFEKQYQALEYTNKYIDSWTSYYKDRDFEGMEKEYKKLEKQLKTLVPIEKTINEAKKIEMLHNLIKNNGQNFNLSNEQLQLLEKFK